MVLSSNIVCTLAFILLDQEWGHQSAKQCISVSHAGFEHTVSLMYITLKLTSPKLLLDNKSLYLITFDIFFTSFYRGFHFTNDQSKTKISWGGVANNKCEFALHHLLPFHFHLLPIFLLFDQPTLAEANGNMLKEGKTLQNSNIWY